MIFFDHTQWALYVMTFIDVTKQNGVGSGGTLPENVWREQCFAEKDFLNSNKIACGCYTRYRNGNKYICASIRAVGLVSGQKAIANLGQMQ